MTKFTLRPATTADAPALNSLAVDSGLFSQEELPDFAAMVDSFFEAPAPTQHWHVAFQERLAGAAFYSAEPFQEDVWSLWFIATLSPQRSKGIGRALVQNAETTARAAGARLLLIETASTTQFERTRNFYVREGYEREATLRDYYAQDVDKVVFRKAL